MVWQLQLQLHDDDDDDDFINCMTFLVSNVTRRDAQYNNNTENNVLNYTNRGCCCLCFLLLLLVFDFLADHYVLLCDLPSSLIVQYCNT